MKHAAVSMDIEGNHELIPLDEDVSRVSWWAAQGSQWQAKVFMMATQ